MPSNSNLKVIRRLLKVENVIGENTVQATFISNIGFPIKVKKIWQATAEIRDIEAKPIEDKVIIEGALHKQIYWVAGETATVDGISYVAGEVYEKTVEERFTQFVEVPGAREKMTVYFEARVEYIDHTDIAEPYVDAYVTAADVWRQTVVMELFAKVTETVQMEVVTDVVAPGMKINVEKELLKVHSVVGEDTKQVSLINDVTFDRRIKKIKEAITKIEDITTEIVPDKVIIEGKLHKQIIYVEFDTGRVYEKSVDEKFSAFVHIPGAKKDMTVDVKVDVEYINHDLRDGTEETGFTRARQTVILRVFAKVTEDLQLEVVTNVTGEGIDVTKELLRVESVVGENQRQINLREDVYFERPVKKIVDTKTKINVKRRDTKVLPDKVIIEGILHKQIFYVDLCTEGVFEQGIDVGFTAFVDVPGAEPDMNLQIKYEIEHISHDGPEYPPNICSTFVFTPGQVLTQFPWKQTAVLFVFAKVTQPVQMEVVTDVFLVPVEPAPPEEPCPEPSIRYYIIQPGDTLWKIAQRFGITVEAIMQLNPGIQPENLQIGQQIRIPCGPKG
ncbi:MAG: hypothetical protein PWP65_65 [Clostridia bacterium]|nr:hypothetical protein [Clostridia bacterium]